VKKGARPLTRVEQYRDASRHFLGVELTRTGIALPLRPTELSPTYRVRVDYVPEKSPRIYVVSPKIIDGAKHRYRDGSLCVYWHEYDNTLGFGETIVPWTAEWLYFYELWQVHGKWLAPESPHGGPK
jgi:hypothetical protein